MDQGTVLYLNGSSSSGKHSIIRELQGMLDEPLRFNTGLDVWYSGFPRRFVGAVPSAELGFPWDVDADGSVLATRTGPYGKRLMLGLYDTTAALAATGNNVIVDDVLKEDWMAPACGAALKDHRAYLIGVRCRLDVLESRERARGDRPAGLARCNFHAAHQHGIYDFEVDTSDSSPAACAIAIRDSLAANPEPAAFRQLAERVFGDTSHDAPPRAG